MTILIQPHNVPSLTGKPRWKTYQKGQLVKGTGSEPTLAKALTRKKVWPKGY